MFLIAGLLFVFGNVIALRWWRTEVDTLKKEQHQLDLALIESEALYEERSEWEERQRWLDSVILTFPGREAADAELLKLVQTSAQSVGVRIDSAELLEPPEENEDHFARAGVMVRASGTLNQIAKWIHGFQEPNDFRSLSNFEFESDSKNPGMVHCKFQCWEWRKQASQQASKKMDSEVAGGTEVAIND